MKFSINQAGRIFRWLLIFSFMLLLFLPDFLSAQDEIGSFKFDGYTREYEVYLPQNFESNMPLVVSIHGYSETIAWYKNYTEMHVVADTMGFVLVYPQGIGNSWNVGVIDPADYHPDTDDVSFISTLIDTMKSKYDIDLSHVYACGFSLGGMMSFKLAGEHGHRFAAVASVAGPLFGLANSWEQVFPMPVMHIHGTADVFCRYPGIGDYWSAEKTVNYWVINNQCSTIPDTFNVPDIAPEDNCTMQKITYTTCAGTTEVVFYKGINMGHSWPDSKTSYSKEGYKNRDINANVEILKFFKNYTNPYANIAYGKSIEMSGYVPPSGEMVFMTAQVANPENHPAIVYGMISNNNGTFKDSIQLFDDGLHNDGAASDNVWAGSKWVVPGQEDIFEVGMYTSDLAAETEHYLKLNALRYFTTIGPVVFTDTTHIDGLWTDDRYRTQYLKLKFSNQDASRTATNLKVKMETDDPRVASVDKNLITVNDIAPGKEQWSATTRFNFAPDFGPDSTIGNPIRFVCTIYSNGYPFWIDTLDYVTPIEKLERSHFPLKFRLDQNYPNPFNPSTKIEYTLPKPEHVTITVYNTLGQKIETLVNKPMPIGKHQAQFNGQNLPSGVYFYRLEAGEYVQTRKMLLVK